MSRLGFMSVNHDKANVLDKRLKKEKKKKSCVASASRTTDAHAWI